MMGVMTNLLTGLRIGVGAALLAIIGGGGGCGGSADQSTSPIVTGRACATTSDCSSGQVCGFPTAAVCTAPTQGVCLVYPTPGTAQCSSVLLECGCAGDKVGVPCDYPSGYAPAAIKSTNAATCP